ncbi:alpha/beta fold hydrolase [Caulobacter vibrioides]|uniref:Putative hydrolase or acyltransferase of alpha/beta superfamily n=1 Tax=Caulobacter vibrioides OR37 TaxID=1292034 RepID=R0EM69_CAUVI|nr:alpha/beta hydrolase [Caulobacter vibrioides]ENZ82167.1 putative hydrolase or acyltransferase of alpha/beta superfamily [Caulobacter vibrioides OR37]
MEHRRFEGHRGLALAADIAGPAQGRPVVLLHGGGQTRGSWKNGLKALVERGYRVFSIDARGHGESGWDPDQDYSLDAQVADLTALLAQLPDSPALVGASMGGVTALATLGQAHPPAARALVLVDVTPKVDPVGAQRIADFMRANPEGFATLQEVSDAVAAYNPHRPRPKDLSGLRRNLREVDGRFYWHWDPAFLGVRRLEPEAYRERLEDAARAIAVPTLLVRGARSEIVGDAEVAHFRALMPRARYVDVAGAGHMVAGDRNDAFNAAILNFLADVDAT